MIPISPLKEVQIRVQGSIGAGKLTFRNMILNISHAQPFIHVKIISSKIINNSKYRRGQLTSNQKERGRKEFHICVQQVQTTSRLQSFQNKKETS